MVILLCIINKGGCQIFLFRKKINSKSYLEVQVSIGRRKRKKQFYFLFFLTIVIGNATMFIVQQQTGSNHANQNLNSTNPYHRSQS